ncbi:MAG: hypothetical protein JXQ82_03075 [Methanomicrobiaceae archaeon]|nr:hypothetical protein [Methanomicrobiaceae archaeon]
MRDKILKAADIAEICGVTEEEVKRISKEFSNAIPQRDFGRVKIYEEKAAGIISKISGLTQKGLSTDEILASFGCIAAKKSTKEKVSEKIRENPVSADNKPKRVSPGVIETAEKTVNQAIAKTSMAINRDSDKFGSLEIRISKITARLENLEKEILDNKTESDKKYEELKEMIFTLDKKMSVANEWVDFFENSLDDYKKSQDSLSKNLSDWTEYMEKEIDNLKKPFWKREKGEK